MLHKLVLPAEAVLGLPREVEARMRTKERVRRYAEQHPTASLRDALKACATQLAHCLGPDTEAGRVAKRALDATK